MRSVTKLMFWQNNACGANNQIKSNVSSLISLAESVTESVNQIIQKSVTPCADFVGIQYNNSPCYHVKKKNNLMTEFDKGSISNHCISTYVATYT